MSANSLQDKLDEYQSSHQNPLNKKIHRICVPFIEFSLFGLLLQIPGPINWMWAGILLGTLYYAHFRSFKVVLIGTGSAILLGLLCTLISQSPQALLIFVGVFVLAWVGQFYGHHVEGRRPSFLKDLQFLMIGPIWIFMGGSQALEKK